jgi:two-component system cell cycle sensor histidine kinase/response regulator CckA
VRTAKIALLLFDLRNLGVCLRSAFALCIFHNIYTSLNTPRSVLIVDDSPAIRSVVVSVLRQHGYTAYEAESGVAALAELQHHKAEIGLVLSDVVMPDMDGLTLAKQLRKQMPKLPIVLLSMHINEDTHWVTEEENFSFLPKPFESKQLLETVRSILG